MGQHNRTVALAFAAMAVVGVPSSARAHHAMGNALPGNLYEGLLSGLAHPIIGLDHLLFVLAIGVACFYFGRGVASVMAFLGGTLPGTIAHLYRTTLPYPDVWVALTLVLLGVLFFRGHAVLRSRAAAGFLAIAGIAHGYAYGEAIIGAEATPLVAYLAGFTAIQLLVVASGYVLAAYIDRRSARPKVCTAVGSALSIGGAGFLMLALA